VTDRGAALSAAEAVHLAREALEGGQAMASVTVIDARGEAAPPAGTRMAVWAERSRGTLGDAALDEAAVAFAREVLAGGTRSGTREVQAHGAIATLYAEPHAPPPELVIVGAGHIARPLCAVGALLGFRVTVLDDRPDFATRERFPEAAVVRRADFTAPLAGVPMDARTFPFWWTTSYPATRAVPDVGARSVVNMRTRVVLPAPLGPRRP